MLAIQHRKFDLRHTTYTGRVLKELISKNEYIDLKKFLFEKEPVSYRGFRLLFSKEKTNFKFFSSSNKTKMYEFIKSTEENIESEEKITRYFSGLKKK